jgi:hypothetical protein
VNDVCRTLSELEVRVRLGGGGATAQNVSFGGRY